MPDLITSTDPRLIPAVGDLGAARWWLRNWSPDDDADRHRLDRVVSFCDDHPDALWRTCLGGHLTASAFVLSPDLSRGLLLRHAKLGIWVQPGGHADGDGNLAAVAWREATEETGIGGLSLLARPVDLDVHGIPERGDEPAHLHLDLRFAAIAPPDCRVATNHESTGSAWLTLPEILERDLGDVERLARRAFAAAGATV